MESFDSSIEPRTLCSAALSCGGVRSPGRVGRSPGAYAAGPSPQSSYDASGPPRASCSTLNLAPSPDLLDHVFDYGSAEARDDHRHPTDDGPDATWPGPVCDSA